MQKPIVTIFCAFTRPWAIDRWIELLQKVDHDPALTNFCFIVDAEEPVISNKLKKFALAQGYRSLHYRQNDHNRVNETRIGVRRQRVAEVKNQSKELVALTDGEIVLSFEDDTVLNRLKNFDRLTQPLLDNPEVGFVEGVQMGRWGANMIGAWSADDFEFPQRVWTHLPAYGCNGTLYGEGYEEIDGGGWYGYATRRELYLGCDYYSASTEPWGPDVNFGIWLRRKGFKCLIDWHSVFGHDDHGKIGYPDNPPRGNLVQVIYTKDNLTGKWNREDHEQDAY